ncbi:excinuclease ABC subunit UvrC [Solitalea sp. MAHUQ-68]|uniref:UvrABC system protein C n=1 Tax=Solitalea agri TaxID=2953739 RepID=A0A9X2F2H6_9SPHI|nr:excinuclease ABC subunit UvrC [Solitalea agri]MCO4293492.1 excinuclease ABC subunit UvrC [Solitalea agri]
MIQGEFDYRKHLVKIPHKPGVYQYFDQEEKLIYVGKAKDLRNRVSSYFVNDRMVNAKTRVLVSKIRDIKFTIVDTEIEALLLENNLIKEHKPRYNVLLKDDKTYPSIVIKNEPFPRVFGTRKIIRDGSKYYGPYASIGMMRTMLEMIKSLYPLRNCNLALTDSNIKGGKFRVCLEYQIGNCKGPCEALQSSTDYNHNIDDIKDILKGNISTVVKHLNEQIADAASNLNFELAQNLKDKLDTLENYQSKSTVVSTLLHDIDVVSIASDNKYAFVNYLKILNGSIVQTQTIELKKKLDETDAELLELAIAEFRNRFESTSKEIVVPFDINIDDPTIKFTVPKLGDKKKLLELSQKNVLFFKKSKLEQYEKLNPELRTERVLTQMMNDLHLTSLPRHIECFDNSNFQGKYPVSAMVVFKDGKPSKKDYRHYNVRTVEGPNDFATMKEVIGRRYSRVIEEQQQLPDLIIVDGGKGQLSSAVEVLKELNLYHKVPIIGIAKRLEEIYYPNDSIPLYIDKKSESLKIIQHLRDEAHRFGITHHRKRRDKGTLNTELELIDGIGNKTAENLLKHFKSVKKIREANQEELLEVLNLKQAQALLNYFGK